MASSTQADQAFRERLRRAIAEAVGVEVSSVPVTFPPDPSMGDLASPVCFELARVARKPPRAIAEDLARRFRPGDGIQRVEPAGAGYVNAFLERDRFLREWLTEPVPSEGEAPTGGKTIVEHTNINPNKAAHIGHLRNAVLGDTLVRCLRRLGRRVEVQNYIDDTGVQVADLVVGFRFLREQDLDAVRRRYDEREMASRGERFDYVAWDLYADVTQFYRDDPSAVARREEVLQAMERGGNPVSELAAYLSHRIVRHHLRTMDRIGVRYDLLPKESDILALRFWEDAFERLRGTGAVHRATSGKNAGCWVMDLPGADAGAGEDQKVIVRSNGTVTYVGKDIAYQMWKFGLLDRDFRYRNFDWTPEEPAYPLWSTTADGGEEDHPGFGGAATVYNVIDTRQSYLQRVVAEGLRCLGYERQAGASVHFAYEMVALTPASVRALFPDHPVTPEEEAKAYLEMSGRRGLGVRADDLVDGLIDRARKEVRQRNPDLASHDLDRIARRIAVGALRYYMLRFSRNRVVAFDLDEALAFEGETGPYLQYSVVRASKILQKVAERHGPEESDPEVLARSADLGRLNPADVHAHWSLALQLSRVDHVLDQAVASLELSAVAKHAYVLAQAFSSFYHRFPVAQEEDEVVRRTRAALVWLYRSGAGSLLELMGIEVPERM